MTAPTWHPWTQEHPLTIENVATFGVVAVCGCGWRGVVVRGHDKRKTAARHYRGHLVDVARARRKQGLGLLQQRPA